MPANKKKRPNKALHRTAIPLRSIAAGELWRWQGEFHMDANQIDRVLRKALTQTVRNSDSNRWEHEAKYRTCQIVDAFDNNGVRSHIATNVLCGSHRRSG